VVATVCAAGSAALGAVVGAAVFGMPWLAALLALAAAVVGGGVGVALALLLPAGDDGLAAVLIEVGRTGTVPDDAPDTAAVGVLRSLTSSRDHAAKVEGELRGQLAAVGKRARHAEVQRQMAEERVVEARDAFLTRMSHELRTPLNAVLGYSEMLVEDLDDDELRNDAVAIRQAGRHLLGLVTSVLDLTQLQSGQYEVVPEPVVFAEVVELVVDGASAEAKANKNRLEIDVQEGATAVVDRRMVQSILFNLVHNGCKYTASGTVTVRVRVQGGQCELFVGDTGIGMTERQVAQAYEPFAQIDDSTTRRYDGSGLGLAVCRGFAEAMGGSLAIDTALGNGARVTVTLPAEVAAYTPDDDDDEISEEHTMLMR